MFLKNRIIFTVSALVFASFVLFSCGTEKYEKPLPVSGINPVERAPSPEKFKPGLPFELWVPGQTFNTTPVKHHRMLEADSYAAQGNYQKALDLYTRINRSELSADEVEGLAFREGACRIALGMSQPALLGLSSYFRARNAKEADVDPRFAILFGYAYGHKGEVNQSLAWFSRAAKSYPDGRTGMPQAAQAGVRSFLYSVSDSQLASTSADWVTDSFIYSLIGQERRRRAANNIEVTKNAGGRFWEAEELAKGGGLRIAGDFVETKVTETGLIGAVVPLTGQYASLGASIRNGTEIAFAASGKPSGVKVVYRDDSSDTFQASVAAKDLMGQGASLILGPLMTEAGRSVGDLVRNSGRAMISFSKASDFATGEGVFRLGVTVSGQVASLIDVCQKSFNLYRYAIIYPDDEAGRELGESFRQAVLGLGVQPVLERSYRKGDISAFSAISGEVEASGAEGVFFADNLQAAARFFASIAPQARKRLRPIGTASWDNPVEMQQSRTVLEGAVFVSPFFVASEKPEVKSFVASYQDQFGKKPDFLAAQAFDAATYAINAAQRAASENLSLKDALQSGPVYDGLTGRISVSGSGELERRYAVVTLSDGKLSQINTEDEALKVLTEPSGSDQNVSNSEVLR